VLLSVGCVAYADEESAPSDTMEARIDSMDSATDTRGSDEPYREEEGGGKRKGRENEWV
jgi:hypothetical protein